MPKALPNRLRFTDLAIARLKPPATGEVVYWDALLVGLGCRISQTGRKTWCIQTKGAKRRLGTFPELSVANARAEARELMAGGVETSGAAPFHTIVEQFLAHGRTRKGRDLRQNTVDQYRRNFANYAKPLHRRPFAEITRRDIAQLLGGIATKSGAPTASLVRSMLARLWAYAIEVGEVEYNVVQNTPGYDVPKRSRVLTDGEIAAIWEVADFDFGLILKLLFWTGCRRGEAGGLRWPELIDGEWRIPAARVKNGRDLILPLPRQAVDALAQWPRVVGRDSLFGQTSSRGFNGWARAKKRLDAQLGFARDWDLHDIRRTVQSRLAELGVSRTVVNEILNHAVDPVTAAYDHYDYATEKRDALQLWADKLEGIVSSSQPEVIKLNSRPRS